MNIPEPVLIVDDEPHIRRFLALMLRQLGATQIVEAANGDEALAIFPGLQPGLILLDINMPGRTGIETLAEIRRQGSETVAVMLTSLTSRQIVEETLAVGADCFIRKDTPRQEILRILTELFQPVVTEGEGI